MSSIKFPHASGNSMSIAAPASNPASDLTLTLPSTVGSAGQVLKNSSTAGTLEFGGGGKVLQVVQYTNQTQSAITSDTSFFSGAITPSATSSNVLIQAVLNIGSHTNPNGGIALKRGSTAINVAASQYGGSSGAMFGWEDFFVDDNQQTIVPVPVTFYDTGISTTSATTYSFNTTSINNLYWNRSAADASYGFVTSILTLWEIGA